MMRGLHSFLTWLNAHKVQLNRQDIIICKILPVANLGRGFGGRGKRWEGVAVGGCEGEGGIGRGWRKEEGEKGGGRGKGKGEGTGRGEASMGVQLVFG
jgi:hypothetical protein